MIPTTNTALGSKVVFTTQPDVQHTMLTETNRIINRCSGQEAVKQAIYKILNTERYEYVIYSWRYGVELKDLFGQPPDYVEAEIERRVTEALMMDDRITGVDSFEFERQKKNSIRVTFTVYTIYGDLNEEVTVNI